jgi:hypothetical protein
MFALGEVCNAQAVNIAYQTNSIAESASSSVYLMNFSSCTHMWRSWRETTQSERRWLANNDKEIC